MQFPWLLLAMSHERLGHHAEARQWLDKAIRSIDDHLKDLPEGVRPAIMFSNDFDWRDYQILRAEAEALILYDPIFPANPFAP